MDKRAGPDTRLLYCTTGVLLQKLIAMKNMHKYTHVILDEVSNLFAIIGTLAAEAAEHYIYNRN